LTPDVYEKGYEAYKGAVCIPDGAFCQSTSDNYCTGSPGLTFKGNVTLTNMEQLEDVGKYAFFNFKGTIVISGSFPKWKTIGVRAFYGAGTAVSSITLDGAGAGDYRYNILAVPWVLETVGNDAFNSFKGTIAITGPFPQWKEIGNDAFNSAGTANSKIILDGIDGDGGAFETVGSNAFNSFKGTIVITGLFPKWSSIGYAAFYYASNTNNVVAIQCRGDTWSVDDKAFYAFKGAHNAEGEVCKCSEPCDTLVPGLSTTPTPSTITTVTTTTATMSTTRRYTPTKKKKKNKKKYADCRVNFHKPESLSLKGTCPTGGFLDFAILNSSVGYTTQICVDHDTDVGGEMTTLHMTIQPKCNVEDDDAQRWIICSWLRDATSSMCNSDWTEPTECCTYVDTFFSPPLEAAEGLSCQEYVEGDCNTFYGYSRGDKGDAAGIQKYALELVQCFGDAPPIPTRDPQSVCARGSTSISVTSTTASANTTTITSTSTTTTAAAATTTTITTAAATTTITTTTTTTTITTTTITTTTTTTAAITTTTATSTSTVSRPPVRTTSTLTAAQYTTQMPTTQPSRPSDDTSGLSTGAIASVVSLLLLIGVGYAFSRSSLRVLKQALDDEEIELDGLIEDAPPPSAADTRISSSGGVTEI